MNHTIISVVDPHHFDAAGPDSTYHPDADPDYDFLFDPDPDVDPDPIFHPDVDSDQDSDPSFKKKAQTLENMLKKGSYSIHFGLISDN